MTAFLFFITQTLDTLNKTIAAAPALPVQQAPDVTKMIDIIMKGGIIMIPIGLLSIIAVYVFIERYLTIRRHISSDVEFMNSIHEYILNGRTDSALTLCRNTAKPIARMIEKGISRLGKPIKEIEEAIEIAGKFEVYDLEKKYKYTCCHSRYSPYVRFSWNHNRSNKNIF